MTALKVYLAARYSRNAEMREVRDQLAQYGIEVTSSWIDLHGGKYPRSFTEEQLNTDVAYCRRIARVDYADIANANMLISFSGGGRHGGRHVEFGLAYAMRKPCWIVGPRENVFHTMPGIEQFDTLDDVIARLDWLRQSARTKAGA